MTDSAHDPIREVVSAPVRARTWLNLLYLLLAFPLGLLYFVFLVIGGSLGLGLSLLWVGVPLLLVTVGSWWAFAALERVLARSLLGMEVPYAPRPWETAEGVLPKLRAHFTSASTWKDLAFVLLKFPLGLVSFVIVVTLGGTAFALIVGPAFGPWSTGHAAYLGPWHVSTWWEAIISICLGLVGLFITLIVANALASLWRLIVGAMLGEERAAQPNQPYAPPAPPADA